MYALTQLFSHYLFVPPSFCLVDLGNGQGKEKVKWLCTLFSSLLLLLLAIRLSNVCVCVWEEEQSGWGQWRASAWICRIVMNLLNWAAFTWMRAGIDMYLQLQWSLLPVHLIVLLINNANTWLRGGGCSTFSHRHGLRGVKGEKKQYTCAEQSSEVEQELFLLPIFYICRILNYSHGKIK